MPAPRLNLTSGESRETGSSEMDFVFHRIKIQPRLNSLRSISSIYLTGLAGRAWRKTTRLRNAKSVTTARHARRRFSYAAAPNSCPQEDPPSLEATVDRSAYVKTSSYVKTTEDRSRGKSARQAIHGGKRQVMGKGGILNFLS